MRLEGFFRRARAAALSALCFCTQAAEALPIRAGPPAAVAQEAPYPNARDLPIIDAWLRRIGGARGARAALVTAQAAYVRVSPSSAPQGRLALRQEVLTPAAALALGGRSAKLSLLVDCAARTALVETAEAYLGPNLTGPAHPLNLARLRQVDPATEPEDFVLLACGANAAPKTIQNAETTGTGGPTPDVPAGAPLARRALTERRTFVQIGAFADLGGAEAAFEAFKAALPAETAHLGVGLEAPVGSQSLRRALAGPFAHQVDAAAFCAKAARRRLACFVRHERGTLEGAPAWPSGTSPEPSTLTTSTTTPLGTSH